MLGIVGDLGSAAANAAFSSSIASVFEQAIVNGEIDLETVLASGLMGGGIEIGKDLVTALINNEAFDFGGLLDEDSGLYETLNGVDGDKYVGGLIGDVRGNFNEFVDKYVTGGEFWEGVGERYDYRRHFY